MLVLDQRSKSWLIKFSACVRERNYSEGIKLFSSECKSFGTVVICAESLSSLIEEQWKKVWPNTVDFSFDLESAHSVNLCDHYVITTLWSSKGILANQELFERHGRATIVLDSSTCKAIHTHFSLNPA